jgi:hypothetical protein
MNLRGGSYSDKDPFKRQSYDARDNDYRVRGDSDNFKEYDDDFDFERKRSRRGAAAHKNLG